MKQYEVCQTSFHCPDSFHVVDVLGKGSYGMVVSAHRNDEKVAIKRIRADTPSTRDLAFREATILDHVKHNNVTAIHDLFYDQDALYVVMELMDCDMASLIQNNKAKGHGFPEEVVLSFTTQLLTGLAFIHASDIVHCDLKPSNLVVNSDGVVKIADFGLARMSGTKSNTPMSTVNYRAPEAFSSQLCRPSIDMWSVGCILFEFMALTPLFYPDSHVQRAISDFTQRGSSAMPSFISSIIADRGGFPLTPICDMAAAMLCHLPADRISASDALSYECLDDYIDEEAEWNATPFREPEKLESEGEYFSWACERTSDSLDMRNESE
eukprot:Sspe_Gene.32164::Locus_15786_Transcript_1_1_Confidence_1.000_Length_1128::g.32164::m.32164/K02206/CDK2; cyclin-dependent kinase 2